MKILRIPNIIMLFIFCSIDASAEVNKIVYRDLSASELQRADIMCRIDRNARLSYVVTNGNADIELTTISFQVAEGQVTSNHSVGLGLRPQQTSPAYYMNLPVAYRRNGYQARGVLCRIKSGTTPRGWWPFS